MKKDVKQLYKTVILKHNKAPFHFEQKAASSHIINAYNPLCGDRFKVYLNIENGKISTIHFHGYGCAISKASTSVLAQHLQNQSLEAALSICEDFFTTFEHSKSTTTSYPDFQAFAAAKDFPGRLKCATLAWDEMKVFLENEIA